MNKYAEASQGNIPYASGPVDPAAYLAQKSEMPVAPTAGGLVAISDQLEAAVNDVRAAWELFRLGPQPEPGADRVPGASRDSDRINHTVIVISEQVTLLRELAENIRKRS